LAAHADILANSAWCSVVFILREAL